MQENENLEQKTRVIFLMEKYPKEFKLMSYGHMELFTEKMQQEYMDWYQNDYSKRGVQDEQH